MVEADADVGLGQRVMVAEDDRSQAEVLRRYLSAAGYTVRVVHDGASALSQALAHHQDLIVLDLMMPEMDGLEVCRRLRAQSDVPVLMLTARSDEEDLLGGLGVGADDYMVKPYSPRELTARVKTLLRRTTAARAAEQEPVHRVGRLMVDPLRWTASLDGAAIDCTPAEFAILAAMAQRPDGVFSRAQLLAHTKGVDRSSTERSIDVHILNLRRKLEADPRRPTLLCTVYGVGYRLSSEPG